MCRNKKTSQRSLSFVTAERASFSSLITISVRIGLVCKRYSRGAPFASGSCNSLIGADAGGSLARREEGDRMKKTFAAGTEGGKALGRAVTMSARARKLNDERIQGLVEYASGLK
jgi:hypothetical protein